MVAYTFFVRICYLISELIWVITSWRSKSDLDSTSEFDSWSNSDSDSSRKVLAMNASLTLLMTTQFRAWLELWTAGFFLCTDHLHLICASNLIHLGQLFLHGTQLTSLITLLHFEMPTLVVLELNHIRNWLWP